MTDKEFLKEKKKLFVELINDLKLQKEIDDKCNSAFNTILPEASGAWYNNNAIVEGIFKALAFLGNDKDNLISYFVYDLEFGKKYKEGCALFKSGKPINLSTASKLFDFLINDQNED